MLREVLWQHTISLLLSNEPVNSGIIAACAGVQPNELQHVRLRTAKHEIMIVVPEAQMDYFMVVVHATDTKAA